MKAFLIMTCTCLNLVSALAPSKDIQLKFLDCDLKQIETLKEDSLFELLRLCDVVIMSKEDLNQLESMSSACIDLTKYFAYVYESPDCEDKIIFSSRAFDFVHIDCFDHKNYAVQIACESFGNLIVFGHLPGLSLQKIDTLKSFYLANNPYVTFRFYGDFLINKVQNSWDLCAKGEIVLRGEADTQGNKSASSDLKIKSDDQKKSATGSIEIKENEKGEKQAKVKIEAKYEF